MAVIDASSDGFANVKEVISDNGAFSYQCEATGLDASDGVVSVEYSNDQNQWSTMPDLSETLVLGSSLTHFNINAINHRFYRVYWDSNSNTTGTITVTLSR